MRYASALSAMTLRGETSERGKWILHLVTMLLFIKFEQSTSLITAVFGCSIQIHCQINAVAAFSTPFSRHLSISMPLPADERPAKYLSINRVNLDVANQIMINGIRGEKLLSYRRRGSELREECRIRTKLLSRLAKCKSRLVFRGGFRAGCDFNYADKKANICIDGI